MSSKLKKQLQILDQQVANDLFVQQQLDKQRGAKARTPVQIPTSTQKLLIKDEEEAVVDFDPALIELENGEKPFDVNVEIAHAMAYVDKEFVDENVYKYINLIKKAKDVYKRLNVM